MPGWQTEDVINIQQDESVLSYICYILHIDIIRASPKTPEAATGIKVSIALV